MNDTLGRPLRNLRLSVTDRCNLRCEYCMPEDDYAWLPREDVLHFEEISALVDVFLSLGVDRVRLTGGEPLLRRDISTLLHMLSAKKGIRDLALTTNGVLLSDQVDQLKAAGLGRITVSLDTLRPDRFRLLTRFDQLDAVHAGIAAATRMFGTLKIDSVVMRGVNEDELAALIEYGKSARAEVRFIEYMDVGGATRWSPDRVVSRREILDTLSRRYGRIEPILRSEPPDGRWHVVSVPLRDAGPRSPRPLEARRIVGRPPHAHRESLAQPRRSRRRAAPRARRTARFRPSAGPPQARSALGNAHARRLEKPIHAPLVGPDCPFSNDRDRFRDNSRHH